MTVNMKPPGYRQYYTRDTLKAYVMMSAKMKLEWLEEINRFLYHATPEKNKTIQKMFRDGKI